jgi:hypothetical protein
MFSRNYKTMCVILAFTGLAGMANIAGAYVLYQENFTGGAVPLHGVAPSTNNYDGTSTWFGANIFQADGNVAYVDVNSEGGLSLPFEPQDGAVYTMTTVVNNPGPGWIGVGFAQNAATTTLGFASRHSNDMQGYLWGLLRDRNTDAQADQQFFRGNQANNNLAAASGDLVSMASNVSFKVVLNTTNATAWQYEVFYNNTSFGGPQVLDATVTGTLRSNINFVGFSKDTANIADPDTAATLVSFLLETSLTPGDVTGEGTVDLDDFNIIKTNLFNTGMARNQGDLTGNGLVDFADFRQWKANAGSGFANISLFGVPEPASAGLLALGALLWCGGVRRRTV